MQAHIIKNGIVVNTIEVESLDFMPGLIDAKQGGSIGDLYDGVTFTKPAPEPQEYKKLRANEYPPMADYLDGIVKNDTQQIQRYIDECIAVKKKYPKPE